MLDIVSAHNILNVELKTGTYIMTRASVMNEWRQRAVFICEDNRDYFIMQVEDTFYGFVSAEHLGAHATDPSVELILSYSDKSFEVVKACVIAQLVQDSDGTDTK